MPRSESFLTAIAAGVCVLSACSKSATHANGEATSVPVAANACDRKLLSISDVDGILPEPITGTAPLRGDPQTCYFITSNSAGEGGPKIMITLRPGLGRVTLKTWIDGGMGTTGIKIGGVGDEAVWVSELKELDAQKNDLLCVAGIAGSGVIGHYENLLQKLSTVCNKIFARVVF